MRKRRCVPKITVKRIEFFRCFRKAVRCHIKGEISLNEINVKMLSLLRCPECHDRFFCYRRMDFLTFRCYFPKNALTFFSNTSTAAAPTSSSPSSR